MSPAQSSSVAVERAPAKVNLCLHVIGRRPDGYHELDTLVAFADVGDTLSLELSDDGAFLQMCSVDAPVSPMAERTVVPVNTGNLAWRGLALAAQVAGGIGGALLTLEKRLPAGAGLGGGSSDAAAAIRALGRVYSAAPPDPAAVASLGADVPMCLDPRPWRAGGIGERLEPLAIACDLPAVLVWPARPLSTPQVFRARAETAPGRFGAPVPDDAVNALARDPLAALAALRNDLTDAAVTVEPAVAEALALVGGIAGCRVARMSGSGSAVFGLFERGAEAEAAAARLSTERPRWWVRATTLRAGRVETRIEPRAT